MARTKSTPTGFQFKELNIQDARRLFGRKRGRGSKYDQIVSAAEKLGNGKAIHVEQLKYAEVVALRKKVNEQLGEGWKVEAAKGTEGLYDVILYSQA